MLGITSRCWILAVFDRDDGERFVLGDGMYDFKSEQKHFNANTVVNDTVDIQGNDGSLLAGQVLRSSTQSFDGYVGDGTVGKEQVEIARKKFIGFFAKNHFYSVIYVFPDGTAAKRQRGFIVDAPEVRELWQLHPEYHVALNFEDVNYYSYAEDDDGKEIFSGSAELTLSGARTGGLVWDELGVVWDELGAVWESGTGGGTNIINIDSISNLRPVWEVKGPIVNPKLENIATNTSITFNGSLTAEQTLIVDSDNMTVTLNGTNVISQISGNWIELAPGSNRLVFSATSSEVMLSKLEWQGIVG